MTWTRSVENRCTYYRYDDEDYVLECANCGIQYDYERRTEIYDDWEYCPGCGLRIQTVDDDGSGDCADDPKYDAMREEPWIYGRGCWSDE